MPGEFKKFRLRNPDLSSDSIATTLGLMCTGEGTLGIFATTTGFRVGERISDEELVFNVGQEFPADKMAAIADEAS